MRYDINNYHLLQTATLAEDDRVVFDIKGKRFLGRVSREHISIAEHDNDAVFAALTPRGYWKSGSIDYPLRIDAINLFGLHPRGDWPYGSLDKQTKFVYHIFEKIKTHDVEFRHRFICAMRKAARHFCRLHHEQREKTKIWH